jgi:hypothetical protein
MTSCAPRSGSSRAGPRPSAAVLDAQSVNSSEGGEARELEAVSVPGAAAGQAGAESGEGMPTGLG